MTATRRRQLLRARQEAPADAPVIELADVTKEYRRGKVVVLGLDHVDLALATGEMVAVTGPSGSGKSTLLNLVGGLDVPTSGDVRIRGRSLSSMHDRELTQFRRRTLGFVFQFFNLLPTLAAWENVAVPSVLDGQRMSAARGRALELLERVGLADRASHRPSEMSGGQLQRIAIARALFLDPPILLADEPTGNLDSSSAESILGLLRSLSTAEGRTVVLVTHNEDIAAAADRRVHVRDGHVEAHDGSG